MQLQFRQVLICNRVSVFQDLVFLAVNLVALAELVHLVDLSSRFEALDLAGAAHIGAKGCKMDPALPLASKGLLKSPDEASELMLAGLEAWEQNHCR